MELLTLFFHLWAQLARAENVVGGLGGASVDIGFLVKDGPGISGDG